MLASLGLLTTFLLAPGQAVSFNASAHCVDTQEGEPLPIPSANVHPYDCAMIAPSTVCWAAGGEFEDPASCTIHCQYTGNPVDFIQCLVPT